MTTFGADAMDRFVATDMSQFTQASIRDLSDADAQQQYWVGNYILNSLECAFGAPQRQLIYYLLRRTQTALDEWAEARDLSLRYLQKPGTSVLLYVKAIGHWKAALSHCWQAFLLISPKGWFEPNDDSPHQRLHQLYNTAKHAESTIASGRYETDGPLVVWLTNEGLSSVDAVLRFEELADLLEDLAQCAGAMTNPQTARAKVDQLTRLRAGKRTRID